MLGPINTYLLQEHNIISESVSLIRREMSALRDGKIPNKALFEKILTFLHVFADQVHHEKEEQILFTEIYPIPHIEGGPHCIYYKELQMQRPSVLSQLKDINAQMGIKDDDLTRNWNTKVKDGVIVSPLLAEHILGRQLVKLIRFEVDQRLSENKKNNNDLIYSLYSYTALLDEHIEKENTCFANTVDKYLADNIQTKVVHLFKEMDNGPAKPLIDEAMELFKEMQSLIK